MPKLKKRKPEKYNVPHGECINPWICNRCLSVTYRPMKWEPNSGIVGGYIFSQSTFMLTQPIGKETQVYPTWLCNDCAFVERF